MAVSTFSQVKAPLGASHRNYSKRYLFLDQFDYTPWAQEVDGTAAVVTDAGVNQIVVTGSGRAYVLQYFVEQAFAGTAPQIQKLAAGNGLTLQVDAANNDGIMLGPPWCTTAGQGTLLTAGSGLFTVGTDAFYARATFQVSDVSEADEAAFGFRKVQEFNTTAIASSATEGSTDMFAINLDNGTLKTLTILNTGSLSTTSTTQTVADDTDVTIEIRVSAAGVVKSYVNGANPTVEVTNFTFDTGDLVMPFFSFVADAATAINPIISLIEWGLWEDRGIESLTDLTN